MKINLHESLAFSGFDIKLCGSRFIGHARPDSDYDFCVDDSAAVRTFLFGLGLSKVQDPDYTDVNFKALFAGRCAETGDWIQVATVINSDLKMYVSNILKQNSVLLNADMALKGTRHRCDFWNGLYSLAGFKP